MAGMNCKPLGVFPSVSYPVSRGTPMISPLIGWDHTQSWNVPVPDDFHPTLSGGKASCTVEVDVSEDSPDHYFQGHMIDGRVLYPGTGYLVLVWRTLAKIQGQALENTPVAFEDVQIHKATIVHKSGNMVNIKNTILFKRSQINYERLI